MPHVHLSEPVLSRITRRRRIRAVTWTAASLGALGALVAMTTLGLDAVDFGVSDGATLDFETGVTHYDHGEAVRILAVRDDGSRLVTEQEDVDDVPGHASLTTIRLGEPGTAEGAFRIDPGLVEYGGALSPDGHTLALVTQDSKVITMDARTGRVTGRRTALEDYEVLAVERWISED
jgi:hypothetical protein